MARPLMFQKVCAKHFSTQAREEEKWRAFKWLGFAKNYCTPAYQHKAIDKDQFKEVLGKVCLSGHIFPAGGVDPVHRLLGSQVLRCGIQVDCGSFFI